MLGTLGTDLDTLPKFYLVGTIDTIRHSILTRVLGKPIDEIPGFRYELGDDNNTIPNVQMR